MQLQYDSSIQDQEFESDDFVLTKTYQPAQMNAQPQYYYKDYLKKQLHPKTQQGKKILEIMKKQENQNNFENYLYNQILNFKEKPTKTPVCNKVLKAPCKIFKCQDCKKHQNACICQECFKDSDHQGHQYYFYEGKQLGHCYGMCDCGNQQIWKKSGFCKSHTGKIQYVKIPQLEQKQFIQIWSDVFGIYFDFISSKEQKQKKQGQKLKKIINQILKKLNIGSVHYNQLTGQLLNSIDLIDPNGKTIFESLISTHIHLFQQQDMDLCISLLNMELFSVRMVKSIIKCHNQKPSSVKQAHYSDFFLQAWNKIDIFDTLAKQDIIFQSKKMSDQFIYQLNFFMKFQHPLLEIIKCLIRKQFIKNNLKKLPNYDKYNYKFVLIQTMIIKLILKDQTDEIKKVIKQIISVQQKYSINKFFMAITKFKFYLQKYSKKKINFVTLFKQIQISNEQLKAYLFQQIQQSANKILSGDFFNNEFIFSLKILNEFNWIDQYFDLFMTELSNKCSNYQDAKNTAVVTFNGLFILNTITLITRYQQMELYLYDLYQIKNQQIFERIQQNLKISFSNQPQGISLHMLQKTVNNIGRQYKNELVPFIKEILKFDQKKHIYRYIGKIPVVHPYKEIQTYVYGQKSAQLSTQEIQILSKIFNEKRVNNIINQFSTIKDAIQYSNRAIAALQIGIKSFVSLHCFLQQRASKIKQFLQKIRSQQFNIFEKIKDNKNIQEQLKKTLNMKKTEIDNPQINSNKEKNFKQRAAQMKKKKFEQLKKKQQKVKHLAKDFQQQFQMKDVLEKQICLLCHEQGSNQNILVSFININKTNILSWYFNSKIYQYDIRRCQHKVHENCFIKSLGNRQYFQCPLCKDIFNCIIPCDFSKQINVKDSIWLTRVQTFLVCHYHQDNFSAFEAFVRNLVYSKALKILIENDQKQTKQRKKVEQTLENVIKIIYQQASPEQKSKYLKIIANILVQLQKQEHKSSEGQLTKKLRIFVLHMFAYYLGPKPLINIYSQLKILYQLSKTMEKKHFYKLMDGISENVKKHQDFIKVSNQLDQYYQSKIQNEINIKPFKIYQLPEKAEQYLQIFNFRCLKCKQDCQNTWTCLVCKQSGCQKCQKLSFHVKEVHYGNCIILKLKNGFFSLIYENLPVTQGNLYKNDYNEPWMRLSSNSQNFKLKDDLINDFFNFLMVNQIPNMINKEKLTLLLNRKAEQDW